MSLPSPRLFRHGLWLHLALLAATAQAADAPGWAHLGPVAVQFHSRTTLSVAGVPLAGADATASNNTSLGLEIGREVAPATIVSLTLGIPPTTTLTGHGTAVDGARLGQVRYGPAVLSVHRHFDAGAFNPYLGVGVNYTAVLASRDGAVRQLDVKSAWGSVLQAGVDVPLSPGLFAFVDLKQVWVKARATGDVGAPAAATVTLNPTLLHAGLGLRF